MGEADRKTAPCKSRAAVFLPLPTPDRAPMSRSSKKEQVQLPLNTQDFSRRRVSPEHTILIATSPWPGRAPGPSPSSRPPLVERGSFYCRMVRGRIPDPGIIDRVRFPFCRASGCDAGYFLLPGPLLRLTITRLSKPLSPSELDREEILFCRRMSLPLF